MLLRLPSAVTHLSPSLVQKGGVFLSKIAEQGFGIEARHIMNRSNEAFAIRIKAKIAAVASHPLVVRETLDDQRRRLLSPMDVSKNMTVDKPTIYALMDLLCLHDKFASVVWAGEESESPVGRLRSARVLWAPFTTDLYAYFALLHGLELAGAITGVAETFQDDSSEYGGGPDFSTDRTFTVDPTRLQAYLDENHTSVDAIAATFEASPDFDGEALARSLRFETSPR